MAQPTIIATESVVYAPTADSGATRAFTEVDIPAAANTIFVMFVNDNPENAKTIDSLVFDNSTIQNTLLHTIDVSSSTLSKVTQVNIYDTRDLGAFSNEDVTGTLSSATSGKSLLGVVCTDGFLESFSASDNLFSAKFQLSVFSANFANNTLLQMGSLDGGVGSFSYTTGTEVYKTASASDAISLVSAKQTTNSSGIKTIAGTKLSDDLSSVSFLISSQPNPLADISPTGDIISHDIITN
jgi:hypothetical protein